MARRAWFGAWLGELGRLGLVGACALGALVLLLRAALDVPRPQAVWALAPLALVPVAAWLRASRGRLSEAGAAVWLDTQTGSTGLLLTDLELGDERWRARAEELAVLPSGPALDVGGPLGRLASGALFAALAVWITLPARAAAGPPVDLFHAALERLASKLTTLEGLAELDPELLTELQARLQRMTEQVEVAEPEGLFEAMDRFEQQLSEQAESLADLAQQTEQGLALAERLIAADPGGAAAALESAFRKLQDSGLAAGLAQALGDRLESGALDLESLAELGLGNGAALDPTRLAELSGPLREALRGRAGDLLRSGLLDPSALQRLHEARALGESLLQRALPGMVRGEGKTGNGAPGTGGVTEGRADAELTWGDEGGREAAFEPDVLPEARYLDAEHSAKVDETLNEPLVNAEGESAGLVEVEAQSGASAWQRRLAPRHREAVRTFFSSERTGKEEPR